jgi:hypothetical protein
MQSDRRVRTCNAGALRWDRAAKDRGSREIRHGMVRIQKNAFQNGRPSMNFAANRAQDELVPHGKSTAKNSESVRSAPRAKQLTNAGFKSAIIRCITDLIASAALQH